MVSGTAGTDEWCPCVCHSYGKLDSAVASFCLARVQCRGRPHDLIGTQGQHRSLKGPGLASLARREQEQELQQKGWQLQWRESVLQEYQDRLPVPPLLGWQVDGEWHAQTRQTQKVVSCPNLEVLEGGDRASLRVAETLLEVREVQWQSIESGQNS